MSKDGKPSSSMGGAEELGHVVKFIREKHAGRAIADGTDASAPWLRIVIKGHVSDQMTIPEENVGVILWFVKK